ncbi:MAG TPA: ImmA/IrrE family metallo-endopeptidase [Solirubrobacterales bacterium]|nr:ImmA/IrrE family metallo-endopeptidase [Solirubrobacterales bacterium]
MPGDDRLSAAIGELREAADLAAVRATLFAWAPRFHDALDEKVVPGPRPELGMDLATMPGRVGFAAKREGSFFVGIGADTEPAEKRFTLAHELGHVLLRAVDDSVYLNPTQEERLCESFASRAIAPREEVDQYIRDIGLPLEPAEVIEFAESFRITQRASVVILDEFVPEGCPRAVVSASWRTHPQRDVLGLRIDAAASDPRFLFPVHCRLGTLGYLRLQAAVLRGGVGSERRGHDSAAKARSRTGKVLGWGGPSDWIAEIQLAPGSTVEEGHRGVLCCLGVEGLKPISSRPRPRARLSRRPADIPGQLRL